MLVLQSSAQYMCQLLNISSQVMKILLLQTSKLLRTKSNLLELILHCLLISKANPGITVHFMSLENTHESPISSPSDPW